MAEKDQKNNPSFIVSDAGAPEGSCYVHDERTGATVVAPATQDGYLDAIRDLNNR